MLLFRLIFVSVFANILAAPWTLNIPIRSNDDHSKNTEDYHKNGDNKVNYYENNNGNYNSDDYHTYMEKKVFQIVSNGAVYLEGLKRSLQNYTDRLENCTKYVNNNTAMEVIDNCQKATVERERVRRVAQLAIWTTREIQDREHKYEDDLEDNTLLLRLAWLLDRLAHMTGYDPKPKDFLTTEPSVSKSTAVYKQALSSFGGMNLTDDLKMKMIRCLDKNINSTQPAYERCPSENPMLRQLQVIFNMTDNSMANNTQADSNPASSINSAFITLPDNSKIHKKEPKSIQFDTDIDRHVRKRRAVYYKYEKKPISRIPENPQQDISGYLKSKTDTNINNNAAETARLRLYMEQAFQNPNIQVARRYGSNYNPLVPNVLVGGLLRSALDV